MSLEIDGDSFDVGLEMRVGSYSVDSLIDKDYFRSNILTFLRVCKLEIEQIEEKIQKESIDLYKFSEKKEEYLEKSS